MIFGESVLRILAATMDLIGDLVDRHSQQGQNPVHSLHDPSQNMPANTKTRPDEQYINTQDIEVVLLARQHPDATGNRPTNHQNHHAKRPDNDKKYCFDKVSQNADNEAGDAIESIHHLEIFQDTSEQKDRPKKTRKNRRDRRRTKTRKAQRRDTSELHHASEARHQAAVPRAGIRPACWSFERF